MSDSVFLTDLVWLTIGAALIGWAWVCLRPTILDNLEDIARAYLRHRDRTHVRRLARRSPQVGR
ncbi:MAG TPA: hypothetical protein VHK88_19975 [Aquihabitans sp.]|jgi:hypothetical protein|nr:hypothetical protein [Aquihabitans sp.]